MDGDRFASLPGPRVQEVGCLSEGPVELRDPGEVLDEAVVGPGVAADGRVDAGLPQALAVEFALVPQGVVLGRDDQGGRQAGEVLALDGGDEGIRRISPAVKVEGVEGLRPAVSSPYPDGVLPQRGVTVDVEVQVQRTGRTGSGA